ncbi:trehalose-phosphatase [uncultured Cohaesibacter sp.]|uniref:trehalose-phosphatase n=1 Tax=uncultured Cohaesibacter sp. TaxID=1002546 RepID=UPI00292E7041|nr:trehalose-phosphatase [uncultured Cohaesibacter sp.]
MNFQTPPANSVPPLSPPPVLSIASIALMLDFDGTLIPYSIKDTKQPKVDKALPSLLEALQKGTEGATAIVSGRGILELDSLLCPARLPISGTHGAQIRLSSDGEIKTLFAADGLSEMIRLCKDWAAGYPEVEVEQKPITAVLHFHGFPALEAPAQSFAKQLCEEFSTFIPQFGIGSVEMKPEGANKAVGVTHMMQEATFQGRRPIFIGDDLADEAGFECVNQMGGISIKVGQGETIAKHRLADAMEVRSWLASLLN